MSGRSSAGRSLTSRGRGRGRRNSMGRGNYGSNVSHDDTNTNNDEHTDQFDGLPSTQATNSREVGSPSSQAQGSNEPQSFLADPNRLWISITPDRSRFTKSNGQADNGQIVRSISTILKQYYRGVWPTWTSVPVEEQNKMFDRFKLKYCWDPTIDVFVRDIFNVAIARRLADRLSLDRDLACAKAEEAGNPVTEDDLSPIIPYNPSWMKQEYWSKLVIDHWNKEDWLKTSKANKANRAKFKAGLHCTGSAGYVAFRERLEKKKGCPPSSLDFLIASHTKKGTIVEGEGEVEGEEGGGTSSEVLIDDRARDAVARLSDYMIEKYGPDVSTHPKHDQELWERAIGSRKKGRSYCSGTSSDPSFILTGISSGNSGSSYVRPGLEEVERMKQKMEEMLESQEKARHDMEEREAKMVEAHEKAKREMEEREERLKKEVEDTKRELNEKLAEFLKHIPNFPKS